MELRELVRQAESVLCLCSQIPIFAIVKMYFMRVQLMLALESECAAVGFDLDIVLWTQAVFVTVQCWSE